ncbi:MAG: class I SAM-dependent methyltransferase [Gammaproteobacteria bacterium]|nr:class I SAM-dependent methyltransferase [Gammaproteobacteria bacterium]
MEAHNELKKLYESGVNISQYLREKFGLQFNDDRIIELTYDLQSGSYIDALNDEESRNNKKRYTDEMARIIQTYCPSPNSLLKGGTGECVTLLGILQGLDRVVPHIHGFDMCWSRVAYGRQHLSANGVQDFQLATGTLSAPPYMEHSFEVVVTSHSMEPNGGREAEILQALYRVTGEWLILFEPSYEHASPDGKHRMDAMGYVKDLPKHAKALGYEVVDHFPLAATMNPMNPTAATIIRKPRAVLAQPKLACPITHSELSVTPDGYFSIEGMCMYPVISGIGCLKHSNAIVASKYPDFEPIK